jgi:hypothetical protein
MKKLTLTALALAVIALASTGASAATTVSSTQGDLVLGFEINDGQGPDANYDLEVDLGASSGFTANTATEYFTTVTGTDLSNTFGSTWATTADLVWGVAGTTTGTNAFDSTDNTGSPHSLSSLSGTHNLISPLTTGLNGQTQESDSAKAAELGTSSTAANKVTDSYSQQIQGGSGKSAFDFSGAVFNQGETQVGNGLPTDTLELYSFTQANGGTETPVGIFSLTGSGSAAAFSFTGINEVPEPSSYALMLVSGLGLVIWRAKRRAAMMV